jgi:hypothetical protein
MSVFFMLTQSCKKAAGMRVSWPDFEGRCVQLFLTLTTGKSSFLGADVSVAIVYNINLLAVTNLLFVCL